MTEDQPSIRLARPAIDTEDEDAVVQVLRSGNLTQGERVAEFEGHLTRLLNTSHAVAVSSGTAALHLALLALGIGRGDIVMASSYSWPATANVIEVCGAQTSFIDIDPTTFNATPATVHQAVERHRRAGDLSRVRAMIIVHAFGQIADLPAIAAIAHDAGIVVIEDAACALGSEHLGSPAGTWGTLACFSFHPRKAVTTGEGGLVVTRDTALERRLKMLRNHGQDPTSGPNPFVGAGLNYRLTEMQAALGISQLAKLPRLLADRRALAVNYNTMFADTGVITPAVIQGANPNYQSYVVTLPVTSQVERDRAIERMRCAGIETTIGTWHQPLTPYFSARYGHRVGDFPGTDQASAHTMSLPVPPGLSLDGQHRVVETLQRSLR